MQALGETKFKGMFSLSQFFLVLFQACIRILCFSVSLYLSLFSYACRTVWEFSWLCESETTSWCDWLLPESMWWKGGWGERCHTSIQHALSSLSHQPEKSSCWLLGEWLPLLLLLAYGTPCPKRITLLHLWWFLGILWRWSCSDQLFNFLGCCLLIPTLHFKF